MRECKHLLLLSAGASPPSHTFIISKPQPWAAKLPGVLAAGNWGEKETFHGDVHHIGPVSGKDGLVFRASVGLWKHNKYIWVDGISITPP